MKKLLALITCCALILVFIPIKVNAYTQQVSIKLRNVEITNGDKVTYWLNKDLGVDSRNAVEGHYNVKYNPATRTLTLNNAYIVGDASTQENNDSYAAYIKGNVNIVLVGTNTLLGGKADNTMSPGGEIQKASYGITAEEGSITISGDGVLNAFGGNAFTSVGIYGGKTTIKSGMVNLKGDKHTNTSNVNVSCGYWGEDLVIEDGALNAVASTGVNGGSTGLKFFSNQKLIVKGGMVATRSDDPDGKAMSSAPDVSNYADYFWSENNNAYKHGTINPLVNYDTTWNSFSIAENIGGITVDPGSSMDDPNKYTWVSSSKTLTLFDGFELITTDISQIELPAGSTIIVNGKVTIISGNDVPVNGQDANPTYGIKCAGDLKFQGSGDLLVISNDTNNEGYGIFAEGNITFESTGTINAFSCAGKGSGIKATGEIINNSGIVNAFSTYRGLQAKDVVINDGASLNCRAEETNGNGIEVTNKVKFIGGYLGVHGRDGIGLKAMTIEMTSGNLYATGNLAAAYLTTKPQKVTALGSSELEALLDTLQKLDNFDSTQNSYLLTTDPAKTLTLSFSGESEVVNTSNTQNIGLWIMIGLVSLIGLSVYGLHRKKA